MPWYIYENKNGFYKKTYRYHIITIISILIALLFGALYIKSSVKSNELGRYNDELTERLSESTDTCTRLTGELRECTITIDQCRNYCNELGTISERNISSVREAVEIIEELREEVGELEIALGLWDSDGYYDWLDSYVFDDEVK